MDCLITWGAAATDGGCRLVAAATVWRVAGRFPLVGRAVVRLCSLALVAWGFCVYVTVEVFVDIGCVTGIECVFGRACWLKTRRTRLLSRAPLMFWT